MKRNILSLALTLLLTGMAFASAQDPQRGGGQLPQQQGAQQPPAAIEGTVTRSDNGQPLKNARVTLGRAVGGGQGGQNALGNLLNLNANATGLLANLAGAVATVTTDGNGRFSFTNVTPGQYRLSAERDGFLPSEYGQRTSTGNGVPVSVSASQHLTVDLKMLQASVISGRVLTPDGEPETSATVRAYTHQYANGQRTLATVKTVQTNDLGEYRLFGLQPGDYFVSVTSDVVTEQGPVGAVDVQQGQGRGRGGINAEQIQQLAEALGGGGGRGTLALGGAGTNATVYYPGTLDAEGAIAVTVVASVEVRGVDFNLRPVRVAAVSGRVVAPFPLGQAANAGNRGAAQRGGGQPNPGTAQGGGRGGNAAAQLLQLAGGSGVQLTLNRMGGSSAGAGGGLLGLQFGGTPVNTDGGFEIRGVAPGQYNILATARDPNGQEYTGRTRIDVGSSDVANLSVTLRPGVEVHGKFILDGTPPEQLQMSNLRVSLVGEGSPLGGVIDLIAAVGARGGGGQRGNAAGGLGGILGGQGSIGQVAADGTFTLQNVGAMEYRVRVSGLPQGAYLEGGRIESTDILNGPFTVDNPGALVQLQLGFSPGRVSGTVTDSKGAPVASVPAVLVPDEARRGRSDAYFTANTNKDGQFTFNNVPPGRYKVFSWEDIRPGAYQYPDFIRAYEDRGQSITVNANGAITADVRLISAN